MAEPTRSAPLQRRMGWLLLAAVVLVHMLTANELLADRFGWGAGSPAVARIEVTFVRELAQSAPPTAPPVPSVAVAGAAALPAVATAASAAGPAKKGPLEPEPAAEPKAAEPPPPASAPDIKPVLAEAPPAPGAVPEITAATAAAASAVANAVDVARNNSPPPPAPTPSAVAANTASTSAAAPNAPLPTTAAQAFDWPPSTRLSYQMTGHFRGPIQGRAQVDWLRSGSRYQVHLEIAVAPLLSRRIASEGELTERGLVPRRFDGEQKVILRAPRRWSQQFGPERVVMTDGSEVPMQPGAQDEASQFVQLTWLFTTQPQLLRVGNAIDIPLAINRRLDRWTYEVKEVQPLHLPFGEVETFHVKPRRAAQGGEMAAEIWFAPSLQYLPVRILIRQDEATYVDLLLDKPPLQATR